MIAQRRKLDREEWQRKSQLVAEHLFGVPWFVQSRHVMLYLAIEPHREVDTSAIVSYCEQSGKKVSVPLVRGERLLVASYRSVDPLERGLFGQSEPVSPLTPSTLPQVVITPVVAVDRSGERLGYGAGYYDRFFADLQQAGHTFVAIGLAFDQQLVSCLPSDPWDRRLDCIVTEKEIIPVQT